MMQMCMDTPIDTWKDTKAVFETFDTFDIGTAMANLGFLVECVYSKYWKCTGMSYTKFLHIFNKINKEYNAAVDADKMYMNFPSAIDMVEQAMQIAGKVKEDGKED